MYSDHDTQPAGTGNPVALTVVVPFHNEAGNVESLIREIAALEERCDIREIIGVDDNSSDNTLDILKHLQSEFPKLRVLHHRNQCGQTAAIFTGIRAARTPWVVTMDGDGQNDPADIPNLLAALSDSDNPRIKIVNGNRNRKNKRKDTAIKKASSRIANSVRSFMLNDNIPDSGCGLKLMHRETYLSLPYFRNLHRFTPALFIRTGAEVISADVNHRERAAGDSHYGLFNRLWIGIVDLLGVTWLMKKGYDASVDEIE